MSLRNPLREHIHECTYFLSARVKEINDELSHHPRWCSYLIGNTLKQKNIVLGLVIDLNIILWVNDEL